MCDNDLNLDTYFINNVDVISKMGFNTIRAVPLTKSKIAPEPKLKPELKPEPTIELKDIRNLANIITLYCDSEPNTSEIDDSIFTMCGRRISINTSDEKFPILDFINALISVNIDKLVEDEQNIIPFETILKLFIDGSDPETKLDPEDLTIKLFYLGHHFDLWKLIDPFVELKQSQDHLRYQISSIIWPYIILSIGYIEHIAMICVQLSKK